MFEFGESNGGKGNVGTQPIGEAKEEGREEEVIALIGFKSDSVPKLDYKSYRQGLAVKLEHYFDFLREDDIRLKGTRMGIETILYAYIHQQRTAEEIAQIYPQITLEQIYATILYYLHNQTQITQYLTDWLDYCTQKEREQDENPTAIIARLQQIKAERSLTAHG